jgi:hypothetical protein
MDFAIHFDPSLRDLTADQPTRAKDSRDRLSGKMEIRLGHAVAEYGLCQLIDYYLDLAAEIQAIRCGEDHLLRMSEYPVAEVKFVQANEICIRVLGGTDSAYIGPFSRHQIVAELGRARRELRELLRSAGEIQ